MLNEEAVGGESTSGAVADEAAAVQAADDDVEQHIFECSLCGAHAPYDYFGERPPFTKPIVSVLVDSTSASLPHRSLVAKLQICRIALRNARPLRAT